MLLGAGRLVQVPSSVSPWCVSKRQSPSDLDLKRFIPVNLHVYETSIIMLYRMTNTTHNLQITIRIQVPKKPNHGYRSSLETYVCYIGLNHNKRNIVMYHRRWCPRVSWWVPGSRARWGAAPWPSWPLPARAASGSRHCRGRTAWTSPEALWG